MIIREDNKRIAFNTIFMSVRMVIVLCLTLYTTRILLSALGIESYGVYNVVCGFVSMFTFINTSMSNGIQRFFNYEYGKGGIEKANKVYSAAIITQIIIAVIVLLFVESFGLWYLHNKLVIPEERFNIACWIYQFSVIGFIFIILKVPYNAVVMAHERMEFFSIISVFDAIFNLFIVLILKFISIDKLLVYGALVMFCHVLNFLIFYYFCKRSFKGLAFMRIIDKELLKSMFSFSGWNLLGSFSYMMKEQGINILLNLFFGPVVNAAKGIATQVNNGFHSFIINISVPVRPQVIQSYARGELQRTMSLTYSVSKLSAFFLYFLSLPILVEIDSILILWLGGNVPEHSASFVIIVVLTSYFNNLINPLSTIVHASGKMRNYQVLSSVVILSCIPLSYFALRLGAVPELAFIMVSLSMLLSLIISVVTVKRIVYFKTKDYFNNIFKPLFIVIFSTFWIPFIPKYLMDEGLLRIIVVFVISILTVLSCVYILGLNKVERTLIKSILSKLLRIK